MMFISDVYYFLLQSYRNIKVRLFFPSNKLTAYRVCILRSIPIPDRPKGVFDLERKGKKSLPREGGGSGRERERCEGILGVSVSLGITFSTFVLFDLDMILCT
jgi:hypothetical protein